ncbi:MAG: (Fe-S)-binding protein [Candidatus Obscuribacter sp.]|nr:(Fe-S)-binding protein [Candidatus Obscuribacter sp.]
MSAPCDKLELLSLSKELLESCIHCGLCLPACPTYLATGRETESPRGRIYAVTKWQEKGGDMDARTAEHLNSCLGCLGCQTACPSGVKYEQILEGVRPTLGQKRPPLVRAFMRFAFAYLLPNYFLLSIMGAALRLVQRLKLDRLPLIDSIQKLREWRMFTPQVPPHRVLPTDSAALPGSGQNKTAQFFKGCVMDVFYNDVNNAALRVLNRTGTSCHIGAQTCCGALAFHAGDEDIALNLARQNINYFSATDGDIVVTSAGCGAILKSYGHLLANDQVYADKARAFASRVKDFSEAIDPQLLKNSLIKDNPGKRVKVAYHAACHLAHAQGVRLEPQALLDVLAQSQLVELIALVDSEHCCGSAGIYNLINTELSLKVLDAKMQNVKDCAVDCVVTSNPGCLLQLNAGVSRDRLNVKVKHLAQLLDSPDAH